MFKHVVEREQTPHQHFRRRDPPAAAVAHAERPVDPTPVDPADAADAGDSKGRVFLGGHALRDEAADCAPYLLVVATQKVRPLRPGEDTAVETSESDPLGAASRPAEGLQCLRAFLQVDGHSRCYLPPALGCGAGAALAGGSNGGLRQLRHAFNHTEARSERWPLRLVHPDLRRRNGAMTVALPPSSRS